MIRVVSMCGCFTDKRSKEQGKCHIHAGNKVAKGFTRIEVVEENTLVSTH